MDQNILVGADPGFIGESVYLFCSSEGPATFVHASIDGGSLSKEMKSKKVNGSGINVGVISDSSDHAGTGTMSGSGCSRKVTGTSSQQSGNLPSTAYVVQDYNQGTDEGRAMTELVYDVAPRPALMSYMAGIEGEAGFATAVHRLRSCGADIATRPLEARTESSPRSWAGSCQNARTPGG